MKNLFEQLKDENFEWQQGSFEHDGILWDYYIYPPRKIITKFLVTVTKDKQIQYTRDQTLIRIDQYQINKNKPEILTNLEQIHYLQLIGQYGKNNQKIGKWTVTWNGELLKDAGGEYSENGKKQGQWKELIQEFWREVQITIYSLAQAYEVGQYLNDQRRGRWKFIFEDIPIGGGRYNMLSQKNGKWIDLSNHFWSESQVTYQGEYKNGQKISIWEIWFYDDYQKQNQLIGCGSYQMQQGNSIKTGLWFELNDVFCEYKNGKKVGQWDILIRKKAKNKLKKLGGGLYDDKLEGRDSIKIGQWIELDDQFKVDSQLIYMGEYKNGKKVGKWDIQYDGEQMSGGQYDDKPESLDSIKIGKWIELSNCSYKTSYVIYNGEYVNGKKVGLWDILYRRKINKPIKLIGGGLYDYSVNQVAQIKKGRWIEISDGFYKYSQIIQYGEYKNGKKAGKWVSIDLMENELIQEIEYDN